jgi:hypothetical protein
MRRAAALGLALFLVEYYFCSKGRPSGTSRNEADVRNEV